MTRHRRGSAGFTLLEVLVALVVLALLMAGIAQGTRFGLAAWSRQSAMLGAGDDLDAVDRTLRAILAPPNAALPASGGGVDGRVDRLALDSLLPLALATGDRSARIELVVDARRLMIRWTPRLASAETGQPARGEIVLIDNIEQVQFGYWGSTQPGLSGWLTQWTGPQMPALTRVHLVFPDGDPRRWPDIVVAAMVDGGLPSAGALTEALGAAQGAAD
jgi:general secretion pathway protein J